MSLRNVMIPSERHRISKAHKNICGDWPPFGCGACKPFCDQFVVFEALSQVVMLTYTIGNMYITSFFSVFSTKQHTEAHIHTIISIA
jgi:hypothetical protein